MARDKITPENFFDMAIVHIKARSEDRGGLHPIIRKGMPEFLLWWEYFDRHLGKIPWAFQRVVNEPIGNSFTAPEADPTWFDPSFSPSPSWRPPRERWQQQTPEERAEVLRRLWTVLGRAGFQSKHFEIRDAAE